MNIVLIQGEMDMDEDQLKRGMLPIHIPLAYHDRFIKEVKEGKDITTAKGKKINGNLASVHMHLVSIELYKCMFPALITDYLISAPNVPFI